jgi:Flp pilus assembly protein TadD
LRQFWELDADTAKRRHNEAHTLVERYVFGKKDSLPAALEAARIDPSSALAYREAARILIERGDFERGRALVLQGLRLDGDDARLWGLLSAVYMQRRDDARARRALEHGLEIDARAIPNGHRTLAILAARAGDLARADSLLEGESKPDTTLQLYLRGLEARQHGDLQGARAALSQAARDPAAPVAIVVAWGNAAYEAGSLQEADSAYARALCISPDEPAALNGRATVQRARGDLTAAVASLQRLVARHPGDRAAQFNLAATSVEAAQRARSGVVADSLYAIAEKGFSHCIETGYRSGDSRDQRAHIRLRRGDAAGTAADARLLLNDPARARSARLLLARAEQAQGRHAEVVRLLAPPFAADSLNLDGLDLLGNTYLKLNRPREAADVLRRSHERQPQDWRTAMNLGVALSLSGDLVAAESLLRELAASTPSNPDVLQNLAAVLQRRGRRAEADRILEDVARLRARAPVPGDGH